MPRTNDTRAKVRIPVGTGPYAVRKWETGVSISLARNETYWGMAPAYPRAGYVWRGDAGVRAAMIDKGEADIATARDPVDAAKDSTVAANGPPFRRR